MISLIILIAFVCFGFYYFNSNFSKIKEQDTWLESPKMWTSIFIVLVGFAVALFQPFAIQRVDAGNVGIKVNLAGDNRGVGKFEYKTGWVVINKWFEKLYEFPTFQQHIDYPEQDVITKGGFSATIKPSFNYSLKPGDVGDMFSNLRLDIKEIEQKWLSTAITGAVNDVSNKWTVDSIFNERERFESNIVKEVNHRVEKWFTISQLRTNITPPKSLQESIEAKTKAVQNVQVAENERLVAIAEGDRKIAEARADSASVVITAAGEAEAIRRKQITLSPVYNEYIKIQKWDGKLPTVSGSGGTMISMKQD